MCVCLSWISIEMYGKHNIKIAATTTKTTTQEKCKKTKKNNRFRFTKAIYNLSFANSVGNILKDVSTFVSYIEKNGIYMVDIFLSHVKRVDESVSG